MPNGYVHLVFVPRITSTQTIRGNALVNYETGNIEEVEFEGEYDMISFHLKAQMGSNPLLSLLPRVCDLDAIFHMAGNRILASYHVEYDLPITLPDEAFYRISEPILEIDATRILFVEAKRHFLRPIASKRQAQNLSFGMLRIRSWPVPDDVFHSL